MATLLQAGLSYNLVQGVVYALPTKAVMLGSNNAIEVSQDGTTFSPVTLTNGSAISASKFIRTSLSNTILTVKEFSAVVNSGSSGSGGGSATLPTAPLGQVLISQGAGVPPIFSTQVKADSVVSQYNLVSPEGKVWIRGVMWNGPQLFYPIGEGAGELSNIIDSPVRDIGAIITSGGGTNNVLARWSGTEWSVVANSGGSGGGNVFNDDISIDGSIDFIGSAPFVFVSTPGESLQIQTASDTAVRGGDVSIIAGNGGSESGGAIIIQGGSSDSRDGGEVRINGGSSGDTGGPVTITAGVGAPGSGGFLVLESPERIVLNAPSLRMNGAIGVTGSISATAVLTVTNGIITGFA